MTRTNENAGRQPGADSTELFPENYTPRQAMEVKAGLLAALSRRVWVLNYSLEEARQRYADRRQLLREACVCVVLVLLRLAGVRYV